MQSVNPPQRVLVAEDEFLVGVMLEENLKDSGYEVLGPISELDALLSAVETETFDFAIFDINLNGKMVYPAVDALKKRGVPFTLLSGYGNSNLPEAYRGASVMAKPCDFRDIETWLKSAK